jgi:rubredoxin
MSDNREIKNSVFTPAQTHDSRIPSMSQADVVKAEFGLDIPTELVPLPSNGKVYPPSSSLHGKDMVEIRPMTAREEDILTSRALLKKGTVVTELIKSCLIDKSINTLDLVAGDRNALMVAVRITGYGAEYTAEVSCPECEAKSQQTFNLAELPVKRLEIDPVTEGQNLFEFVLPHTKKKVLFKFTTGKDEEELTVIQEKQKKLGLKTDSTVTTALQQAIVSVGGIEDRAKINNFIKAMPARDSLALRNYIRQNEPGLTMKQDMTCPECGHSEEVNMPLGVSFLWPTS